MRHGIILGEWKAEDILNDVSSCVQNTLWSQGLLACSDTEVRLGRRFRTESMKTDFRFQSCFCHRPFRQAWMRPMSSPSLSFLVCKAKI